MKSLSFQKSAVRRRFPLRCLAAAIAIVAGVGLGQTARSSDDTLPGAAVGLPSGAYATTVAYLVQFYPLWRENRDPIARDTSRFVLIFSGNLPART